MMAEAGVSGIECLDPPPLGNAELIEAKKPIGSRVFVKGNIDPVKVLLYGNIGAVEADARVKILEGKSGGSFILSTACSIVPHTPAENVDVLARIADELGSYRARDTNGHEPTVARDDCF